jgi:hypothetical protein
MPGKLWSAEDDAVLLQLRMDGFTVESFADLVFGRTVKACLQRVARMKLQQKEANWARGNGREPRRRMTGFTDDEVAEILRLRDELHWTFPSIDEALDRRPGVCCQKYQQVKSARRCLHQAPPKPRPTIIRPTVLPYRDLTSAFCGDPPPGRSALDLKLLSSATKGENHASDYRYSA